MQSVWSRSLRPQSTCRCISCANSPANVISRRTTTTGIARKRLNAGDAFTLLLGPVLGTAYIIDATTKKRRREDWDAKIAAVKAQVEQLQRDSGRPYNITNRSQRRLPALSRRYNSLATAAVGLEVDGNDDPDGALDVPAPPQPWPLYLGSTSISSEYCHDRNLENPNSHPDPELSEETIARCKRRQRLVAIKLAIRMILHIQIGKSPRYIDSSSDYSHDEGRLPESPEDLIRHLKHITNCLKSMRPEELQSSWRHYQSITRGRTSTLDKAMSGTASRFRRGEINVTRLVEEFAEDLLSSSESPSVHGYIPFLSALSRARFDELGYMVDGTMIEAQLPYDRHAVFILLWQYGKNKDARNFDRLTRKLTTDGANARFGERWLWRNIRGVSVPVPPSQDPQILQILVYAALKCNQPHRAEAWSAALSWTENGHRWLSHIIRNFLKYYSAHKNWNKGLTWLRTALHRAESLAIQDIRQLQRVAFSMLEICVSCQERGLYENILKAACECCLGVYSADPELTITQRSRNILDEWTSIHQKAHSPEIARLGPVEKARLFVDKLQFLLESQQEWSNHRSKVNDQVDFEESDQSKDPQTDAWEILRRGSNRGEDSTSDRIPVPCDCLKQKDSKDHWKELCRQQQEQLNSLSQQLSFFKSLQKSEASAIDQGNNALREGGMVQTPHPQKDKVRYTKPNTSDYQQAQHNKKKAPIVDEEIVIRHVSSHRKPDALLYTQSSGRTHLRLNLQIEQEHADPPAGLLSVRSANFSGLTTATSTRSHQPQKLDSMLTIRAMSETAPANSKSKIDNTFPPRHTRPAVPRSSAPPEQSNPEVLSTSECTDAPASGSYHSHYHPNDASSSILASQAWQGS